MIDNVQLLTTDLSKFSIGTYSSAPKWKVAIWYFINYFIFNSVLPWPYIIKLQLLRAFGAKVGNGVVLKPGIRIKNPWMLSIGDNCWIGESVWIDNLTDVKLGNNVCLSQGAILLTGNHDYSKSDFSYRLGTITLSDGVWIGAQAVVCAGVHCASHAVLTVNSVAARNLDAWKIYSGNPALPVRDRKIEA